MYNRYQFDSTPIMNKKVNSFNTSHSLNTTMKIGRWTPIDWDIVMPGQTTKIKINGKVRMTTSKYPTMDRAYIDFCAFWVPFRLVYKDYKEWLAQENFSDPFVEKEYTIPTIQAPLDNNKWDTGSVADYLGLPTEQINNDKVIRLPINAFSLCWNEWCRSQQLQKPIDIPDDKTVNAIGTHIKNTEQAYVTDTALGGILPPATKLHDYFTSALPRPQFGEPVPFGLLEDAVVDVGSASIQTKNTVVPMIWTDINNNPLNITEARALGYTPLGPKTTFVTYPNMEINATNLDVKPGNLIAKTKDIKAGNITQLRQSIMEQQYAEKRLIYGGRMQDYIKGMYGVETNPNIIDIPELLSTKRTNIAMQQVVQSSATQGTGQDIQPLGEVSGLSNTDSDYITFEKSFQEHGIIMIMATIRYRHSYSQGIDKKWKRTKIEDYYNEVFANKSEQPVMRSEIYAGMNDAVFGYQEPWAEERVRQNKITGQMRPNIQNSQGLYWTYGDNYAKAPILSAEWIEEDPSNMIRTFALQEELADPFKVDLWIEQHDLKPVPIYGVPGLDRI
ncbi:VP1 [Gokushovirus WZ-2015a]|nr:VP1 [Gokushovirus WZ-2015a]